MKPLENAWNGLVQRKLLPLAILLLAGIVAVPFLLAKDPEPLPAAPASPAAAAGAKDEIAKPVVSLTDDAAPAERRRVLGSVKDPFAPGPAPKVKSDETATAEVAGTPATGTPDASAAGTGSAAADTGATAPDSSSAPAASSPAPATTTNPAPVTEETTTTKPTYRKYSVVVRYGEADSDEYTEKTLGRRLTPLPDGKAPAALYFGMGPTGKGDKAAYFLLADGAELDDETKCQPSVRDCQGFVLREGKKVKLNVLDDATGEVTAHYVIEVVKIKSKVVDSAEEAAGKVSKTGLSVLRAHTAAAGPLRYRYEAKSGLVRKLSKRAYKALQAKSARVALATAGGF